MVELAVPPNTTHVDGGASSAPGARFVGIEPTRFVDSRFGVGLSGALSSGAARTFTLAGRLGVPSDAVAVTGSIAVVGQSSAGYLSIGPSAATVARSSVVNTPTGDIRAAGFTVKLGDGGSVAGLWTGAGGSHAHVVVDVTGYFVGGTSGSTYVPLTPARILDTRLGTRASPAPSCPTRPRTLSVTGRRRHPRRGDGRDRQPRRGHAAQRRLPGDRTDDQRDACDVEPERPQGRHRAARR